MFKPIRYGMLGGASDAFIGAVHRMAMRLDGFYQPVCGCFSRNVDKSRQTGEELGLQASRVYADMESMIAGELALPEEERMQLLVVVTPNDQHYGPSKLALENGFHVACDKPLCMDLAEAEELCELVEKHKRKFLVTHTYAGYPMIREARQWARSGKLGQIRRVGVEYPQGWLSDSIEKQSSIWRLDPKRAGASCSMGDIGTHAVHLLHFVSGKNVESIASDLNKFGPGRVLDDDGSMLVRLEDGVRGFISASQIATAEENDLRIQINGTKATLEWCHADPNTLWFKPLEGPVQKWRAGHPYLSKAAQSHIRLPAGHPEGFIEAFANLYRNLALDILKHEHKDKRFNSDLHHYPNVYDGRFGMAFLEAVVASDQMNAAWIDMKYTNTSKS